MHIVIPLLLLMGLLSLSYSGWGPGHHLEFAERVLRRRRERLPKQVGSLLHEHRQAYRYGNLAADIINIKAYGEHQGHCHRWTIVDDMRSRAHTDAQEAFILGYLSHLAADTIAHNHFVPYHLSRYARTRGLGHLYWEMNADRFISEKRWDLIPALKNERDLDAMDELVNATVPKKALSMGANKLLFNHVLLVAERKSWRRGMESLHPLQKVSIGRGFLARFQRAAVDRVVLALHPTGVRDLQHIDTTGKRAQAQALQIRKEVLRETKRGLAREQLAAERAAPFLNGMQSPPPVDSDAQPHWS